MKNFLIILASCVLTYLLSPFYIAAITAWIWLPIVFDLNNYSGWFGFIIGLFVSSGTSFIYHKLVGDN